MSTDNLGNENIDMAVGYSNGYKQGYEQGKKDAVKHGHWEYLGERDGAHVFECSECHDRINTVNPNWLSKYCSGCGAKMLDMEE